MTREALHRYPASMARRTHEVCVHLTERYGGKADKLWKGAKTGPDLFARVRAVPGFGDEKAQIFCALLAKRFGVRPAGWEEACGVFADATPRSVADSTNKVYYFESALSPNIVWVNLNNINGNNNRVVNSTTGGGSGLNLNVNRINGNGNTVVNRSRP